MKRDRDRKPIKKSQDRSVVKFETENGFVEVDYTNQPEPAPFHLKEDEIPEPDDIPCIAELNFLIQGKLLFPRFEYLNDEVQSGINTLIEIESVERLLSSDFLSSEKLLRNLYGEAEMNTQRLLLDSIVERLDYYIEWLEELNKKCDWVQPFSISNSIAIKKLQRVSILLTHQLVLTSKSFDILNNNLDLSDIIEVCDFLKCSPKMLASTAQLYKSLCKILDKNASETTCKATSTNNGRRNNELKFIAETKKQYESKYYVSINF
jgi:hypothetical protein